jgi:hypothetical protein
MAKCSKPTRAEGVSAWNELEPAQWRARRLPLQTGVAGNAPSGWFHQRSQVRRHRAHCLHPLQPPTIPEEELALLLLFSVVAGLCPAQMGWSALTPRTSSPNEPFSAHQFLSRAGSLRVRHLLWLYQLIEFFAGQVSQLHGGFAQARVFYVRGVRDLRRVVVSHFWS